MDPRDADCVTVPPARAFCRFHVDKLSSAHVYLRLSKGQTIADITKEVRAPRARSRWGRAWHRGAGAPLPTRKFVCVRACVHADTRVLLLYSLSCLDQELEDCCQLVKANSIQGCKEAAVGIVYTPWANLRKTSECAPTRAAPTRGDNVTSADVARAIARSMEVGQVGFRDEKAVVRVGGVKRVAEAVNRLTKTKVERSPNLAAEREAYDKEARAERKAEERVRRKAELEEARERERDAEARSYDRIMAVRPPPSSAYRYACTRRVARAHARYLALRAGRENGVQSRGGGEVRVSGGGGGRLHVTTNAMEGNNKGALREQLPCTR